MSQQINLIDPSLRVKRDWLAARGIAAGAAALVLAVGGHWAYERTLFNRALFANGAAPAAPQADPAAADTPLREVQRAVARGERLMQALAGLTGLPRDNAQRLRALIGAMPAKLWLQEVEFSGDRGLRVVGGSTDAASLADFAQRLGALQAFQGTPLHLFKVEPRSLSPAGQTADADAQGPQTATGVYAFILSTQDAEAAAR